MRGIALMAVLVVLVSVWVLIYQVETQVRRITQLEMALAQAHAEADTLEAMLERRE